MTKTKCLLATLTSNLTSNITSNITSNLPRLADEPTPQRALG
ncbi:hypothetical protein N9865_01970 [Paraglaciecola sp.]|nr:hypothetical protein [Paraglaciecola sp.]